MSVFGTAKGGVALIEAKEKLWGNFDDWLGCCPFSKATAYRYMVAAKAAQDAAESNTDDEPDNVVPLMPDEADNASPIEIVFLSEMPKLDAETELTFSDCDLVGGHAQALFAAAELIKHVAFAPLCTAFTSSKFPCEALPRAAWLHDEAAAKSEGVGIYLSERGSRYYSSDMVAGAIKLLEIACKDELDHIDGDDRADLPVARDILPVIRRLRQIKSNLPRTADDEAAQ